MPRVKTTVPARPSREKGQRSLDPIYFNRYVPAWARPHWQKAAFWRSVVLNLPVAIDCREFIVSYISSLDWKIEPKESSQREELKEDIVYHTELFEAGGYNEPTGWDYLKMIEFGLQDALDLPFGAAFETVRVPDRPGGRVVKIIPIDGATMFPTRNNKWPIVQRLQDYPTRPVVFPAHAINRFYYSPRNEIQYEGWGMAPPEKIFLAINMLSQGDAYYWKFMTDSPEAGILDLMDMDQESAIDWVRAFKELWTGLDPFKIPVLYEHEKKAEFISFGKDPNSIEYSTNYARYVTLTCAGYGISPSDIGFPSKGGGGGETLAGSIRDERRTQRSMISRTKKMLQFWFNRMLPDTLRFTWIDLDDEVSVALGRARLANATAMGQYIDSGMFSEQEARLQTIADGLWSTSVPEEIPVEEFIVKPGENNANERPGMLGNPINPSQGGKGEIAQRSHFDEVLLELIDISDDQIRELCTAVAPHIHKEVDTVLSDLDNEEVGLWVKWHNDVLWGKIEEQIPELTLSTISLSEKAITKLTKDWFKFPTQEVTKSINNLAPDGSKEVRSELRKQIRSTLSNLDISKPVIRGTRNWTIKVGLLDNAEEMRDNVNVLTEVRSELLKFYENLLNGFYENLEDYLDGS